MRFFLDSCILIYLVEGSDHFSKLVAETMRSAGPALLCVNDLVRLECLVVPLRARNVALAEAYRREFATLHLLEMNSDVYDLAAQIRADLNVKTPDALHVASAIHHRCDQFWTGDSRLASIGNRLPIRVFNIPEGSSD